MTAEYMVKIRMAHATRRQSWSLQHNLTNIVLTDACNGGNPNDKCGKLQTVERCSSSGCCLDLDCLEVLEYIVYFGHLHNLGELY